MVDQRPSPRFWDTEIRTWLAKEQQFPVVHSNSRGQHTTSLKQTQIATRSFGARHPRRMRKYNAMEKQCWARVSRAHTPPRRRPSAPLVSWSDVGSQSLYRACWANSPPFTPLITRRCSHRPPARQSPAGAHSSPPPHTRACARPPRVLPRAPAPGLTHAFPACSPAPSHPLRRIPLPRAPPGTLRLARCGAPASSRPLLHVHQCGGSRHAAPSRRPPVLQFPHIHHHRSCRPMIRLGAITWITRGQSFGVPV